MENRKFISVVIPTYNRKSLLKSCLDSLTVQTYPKSLFEVIIVDDGSTDGTEDLVHAYETEIKINFSYSKQNNKGPAAARNLGIGKARGELIAFTDDDCTVAENWLEECVKCFDSDYVGGVGGSINQKEGGIISEFMDFHEVMQAPVVNGEILYLVTANAVYQRDILIAVSGFEEKIRNPGGEDPDLSMKVKEKGYVLKYNPDSVVYHYHKDNITSFYKTFYNYGRGARFLWEKWGDKLVNKSLLQSPFSEILGWNNLKAIYGYYKFVGGKKSLPFWMLKSAQIYAISRGFQKGY